MTCVWEINVWETFCLWDKCVFETICMWDILCVRQMCVRDNVCVRQSVCERHSVCEINVCETNLQPSRVEIGSTCGLFLAQIFSALCLYLCLNHLKVHMYLWLYSMYVFKLCRFLFRLIDSMCAVCCLKSIRFWSHCIYLCLVLQNICWLRNQDDWLINLERWQVYPVAVSVNVYKVYPVTVSVYVYKVYNVYCIMYNV